MIKQHVIDRVKSASKLSELVSEYTRIHRSGDQFSALCPFHQERTPSFYIDSSDSVYYCFGCGAKGNVFTFLKEKKGLDFQAAVEFLARRYNIPIEYETSQNKRPYSDILLKAHSWFVEQLAKNANAAGYLTQRGVADGDVQRFKLGFCPDGACLTRELVGKGYKIDDLRSIGLTRYQRGSGAVVDFFANRIIFPIFDRIGRLLGFGGRAIDQENNPKYLNSPDSDMYKKSQVLFGCHLVQKGSRVYVVEGYFDVIRLWSQELQSVCPCGTSLTYDQLRLVENLSDEVIFVFDGDLAGARAALKAATLAAGSSANLLFKLLPDGLDPDDFLRARSKDEFLSLRELTSEEVILFGFLRIVGKNSLEQLNRKELSQLSDMIREYLNRITNPLILSRAKAYYESQLRLNLGFQQESGGHTRINIEDRSFIELCLENPALAAVVLKDSFLMSELRVEDVLELSRIKFEAQDPEEALIEVGGRKVTVREVVEYVKRQAFLRKNRFDRAESLAGLIQGKRMVTRILK